MAILSEKTAIWLIISYGELIFCDIFVVYGALRPWKSRFSPISDNCSDVDKLSILLFYYYEKSHLSANSSAMANFPNPFRSFYYIGHEFPLFFLSAWALHSSPSKHWGVWGGPLNGHDAVFLCVRIAADFGKKYMTNLRDWLVWARLP